MYVQWVPESRDIYQCPQAAATLKYFRYSAAIFMNWSRTNCIYCLCTCAQSQAHLSVITSWGKCLDLCLSYQWCQTYSYIHISHTQWSIHIHMNAIYKYEYDSHPTSVSQSVSQATLSHSLCGLHFYSHKCETTKETINRVLLSWTKKKKKKNWFPLRLCPTLCMHLRGAAAFAFWSIASKGKGGGNNTQYPKYYLNLI